MQKETRWRLIGIFVIGILLLNFPIIKLFAIKQLFLGLPPLFLYVFLVWILMVFFLKRILDKKIPSEEK